MTWDVWFFIGFWTLFLVGTNWLFERVRRKARQEVLEEMAARWP